MKKNITLFSSMILSLMILASCGSSNSESSSSEETPPPGIEAPASSVESPAEEPAESTESTPAASEEKESGNDCEAFLKEYEEWVDEYIVVAKKIKSNPSDMSVMSDYTRMMSELSDWDTKGKDCSGNASAAAKMLKIQSKLASAMN